jgi:hypothetical protein
MNRASFFTILTEHGIYNSDEYCPLPGVYCVPVRMVKNKHKQFHIWISSSPEALKIVPYFWSHDKIVPLESVRDQIVEFFPDIPE